MSNIAPKINKLLTKEFLIEEYKNIKSLSGIAKKYNISHKAVELRFKKYNISYDRLPRKYECDDNFFKKETEESFYIAGFIAADGCIILRKNTYIMAISVSEKDKNLLETIKKTLNCQNPIGIYTSRQNKRNPKWNDTKIAKLSIVSKTIVEDLQKFNIGPRKSMVYDMPKWLIDHKLLRHFIRGYIDGDGCFFLGGESKMISMDVRGTIPFLIKCKEIFKKYCFLNTNAEPSIRNNQGDFRICSNFMVSKIFDYLYDDATIYMERKYKIAKLSKILNNIPICKRKEYYNNIIYCIKI